MCARPPACERPLDPPAMDGLRRYVDLQRAGFYAQQADNLNAFNGFCVFFVTFKYLKPAITVASASRVLVSARLSATGMFD